MLGFICIVSGVAGLLLTLLWILLDRRQPASSMGSKPENNALDVVTSLYTAQITSRPASPAMATGQTTELFLAKDASVLRKGMTGEL